MAEDQGRELIFLFAEPQRVACVIRQGQIPDTTLTLGFPSSRQAPAAFFQVPRTISLVGREI